MEFTISTFDMLLIVKLFSKICKGATDDIRSKLLIEAYEDKLNFYATDGNTIVTFSTIEFSITEEGSCLIEFSKLKGFVDSSEPWDEETDSGTKGFDFKQVIKDGVETIVAKKYGVSTEGKKFRSSIKLHFFPPFEFMKPEVFSKSTFSMNSTMYKNGVYKVRFAVNPNINLDFIKGVNIKIDKSNIILTGTDSVILTECRFKNVNKMPDINIHVPLDFILTLHKSIYSESDLFFEIRDNKIIVKFLNMEIMSPILIGADYPDCSGMFSMFDNMVDINKSTFSTGIRSVLGTSDKEDNNRITIEINKQNLKIYNDYSDVLFENIVEFDGDFIIDLNGDLLYKAIDSINDDTLLLKFSDEKGYFIIDSYNFQDQATLINNIRRR